MTVEQYVIDNVPAPQAKPKPVRKARVKKIKVSDALKKAAKEYKAEYLAVFGTKPTLTFDGTWVRITGQSQGIGLKRLKELTTQLKARRG